MSTRQLGPVVGATLLTSDIAYASKAYQAGLGYSLVRKSQVSQSLCELWGTPSLLNAPMHVLAAENGDPWLRLVEDPDCIAQKPLKTHGWMALETNVNSVDQLRQEINSHYFDVIGEPAYLQVSDAIKAMQVIGPVNEVSYLTQVDKPVPPFELPMTSHRTGSLFIPVLCTPDREASLSFYERLNRADAGLKFDTKVSVLNKAWGFPSDHQTSVATLQLNGNCLIEIDQVPQAQGVINNLGSLPSGVGLVTFEVKDLARILEEFDVTGALIDDDYYPGQKVAFIKGPAGECLELVEVNR